MTTRPLEGKWACPQGGVVGVDEVPGRRSKGMLRMLLLTIHHKGVP